MRSFSRLFPSLPLSYVALGYSHGYATATEQMEPVFPSNIMIELLLPPTLPRDGKWVSQIVGDQQNFRESESEGIID